MLFFLHGWDIVTLSIGFTRNTIPPLSFLLTFMNACLLARSRKQSPPIKTKTETKTKKKKKERHDTGFQLIIPIPCYDKGLRRLHENTHCERRSSRAIH